MCGSRPEALAVTASAGAAGVEGASPRIGAAGVVVAGHRAFHGDAVEGRDERCGRAGLVHRDDSGHPAGQALAVEHAQHGADAVGRAIRPAPVDAFQLTDSQAASTRQ
jgi:hypothetical protein